MKQLTQKNVLREVRKNCNAAIIIINGGFAASCLLYPWLFSGTLIGRILMALATISYICIMGVTLRAGSKLSAKHLDIAKDVCIMKTEETVSFPVDTATNLSHDNVKRTLSFANIGGVTVLPHEYEAVDLGKEYYIITFGKNKDIAMFYSTDKWELDNALKAKLQPTFTEK